ncbi:MAG: plastocyanin/azurin family copper-binding protein [Pseudomonadota bacterium]
MHKNIDKTRRRLITGAGGLGLILVAPAIITGPTLASAGETHIVKARGVKFAPMFIYANPGDKVAFENMASHNVETLDALCPEGQEKVNSELGDNIVMQVDTVGIVSYKCTPHWGNRMGGFIVVGEPENPEALIDGYIKITEEQKEYLPARGLLKKLKKDMKKQGKIA